MMVTLAGAGPGDKGLLTIKALARLQNADVVLYDQLVSDDIIDLIPATAEKINVGKKAGHHSAPQDLINRLLLEKARQGGRVVRLKGGDPFVFGRGGEEAQFLSENKIPFEVIPGHSSAIAGAAYAGIPITHRGYSSSLHIISAHARNHQAPDINYKALVRLKGTLVFMMGLAAIKDICENCIAAGMEEDLPAAIIENATTSLQRNFFGTVKTLPDIACENKVESPAVIIIGEVCRLSDLCDWFSKKPLHGKRIIVARVNFGPSVLSDKLRDLGCYVIDMPCVSIVPLTGPGCPLEDSLKNIQQYTWLVFTSRVGVTIFFDYLVSQGLDIRSLNGLKIACVGNETKKEITKRGINVDYCPDEFNGAALGRGLAALVKNNERLLIARAKHGAKDLTHILADAGIAFDDVPLYDKTLSVNNSNAETDQAAAAALSAVKEIDFVAFTSPFAVEGFAAVITNNAELKNTDLRNIKAVCIGRETADKAESFGMTAFVPSEATFDGMIKQIVELSI